MLEPNAVERRIMKYSDDRVQQSAKRLRKRLVSFRQPDRPEASAQSVPTSLCHLFVSPAAGIYSVSGQRVSSKGRARASQARDAGSSPATRSGLD